MKKTIIYIGVILISSVGIACKKKDLGFPSATIASTEFTINGGEYNNRVIKFDNSKEGSFETNGAGFYLKDTIMKYYFTLDTYPSDSLKNQSIEVFFQKDSPNAYNMPNQSSINIRLIQNKQIQKLTAIKGTLDITKIDPFFLTGIFEAIGSDPEETTKVGEKGNFDMEANFQGEFKDFLTNIKYTITNGKISCQNIK